MKSLSADSPPQHFADRLAGKALRIEPDADRLMRLRVEINEQCALACSCKFLYAVGLLVTDIRNHRF